MGLPGNSHAGDRSSEPEGVLGGGECARARPDQVRVRLIVAYDGAAYAGWQVQKTGLGVQAVIEGALGRLFAGGLRLHSSSRTDTGVHAMGMAAHVDLPRAVMRMPLRKLPLALNAHLPEDVRVMAASRVPPDFHARFHARGKEYRYFLWNHPAMNPLLRQRAWHVPRPLDSAAVCAAAARCEGTHDFRSFAAHHGYEVESTVRTLTRCAVRRQGPLWTFTLCADGFLYKMCRGIVGTLVQVGLGKIPPESMVSILQSRDRRQAGMTAPAHGLVLWRVLYARRPR